MNRHPEVRLLWTGGWDSTFRLLELLLEHHATVTPVYLIDPGRLSTRHEFVAMETLRKLIGGLYPAAAERLAPLQTHAVCPPVDDDRWERARRQVLQRHHLGTQYAFIPRTLDLLGLGPVEMAAEIPSNPHRVLDGHLEARTIDGIPTHVVSASTPVDSPAWVLFHDCRFPLAKVTKAQSLAIARSRGYLPVLRHTWFCHSPRPASTPCGYCVPCHTVVVDGLGWRLPVGAKVRHLWHRRIKPRLSA